ncbi:Sir2 silent information regulator family NAD-dependent deacetylase [Erwinia sp. J316]|uniref:Sir2 silent information regulator family NAD-dependent deacetylase n=2 Tax=Erwinia sorbitola TaxID=2681984 RepID=A0ABW9R6W8_9GAMM|nr:Sir2 silent information regulator family NAD-dependent deacetylase [Erwinia sorbitola]
MNMEKRLQAAKAAFKNADCVLIGAGAGFSAAAGLTYSNKRFTDNFQAFIQKYGMTDMYSAGFYPFPSEEAKWAYWAKHIEINRFAPPALPLYQTLFELVKNKNYFVITTNVDAQFYKAGFAAERIFATQGDYGKLQCATGCHKTLYDNGDLVKQWLNHTDCNTLEIPTELVPQCPKCGGKMAMHLRIDGNFVENADWHAASARYAEFAQQSLHGNTVYLELGVGYNTPGIIRYPFEKMTYDNPDATLVRINRDEPQGFAETAAQTVAFTEDPKMVLENLMENTK